MWKVKYGPVHTMIRPAQKRYVTEIFVDLYGNAESQRNAAPELPRRNQVCRTNGAPAQPMAQSQATPAQDNPTDDLPF